MAFSVAKGGHGRYCFSSTNFAPIRAMNMQSVRFSRRLSTVRVSPVLRVIPMTIVAALLLAWAVPSSAGSKYNLLLNQDLTEGTGGTPDYWHREAYAQGRSELTWILNQWPGQLEVSSAQPNDARWDYDFHLDPGWYHFTASISTKDVPQTGGGASLCLMELGVCSPWLQGTSDWQTRGLYVKVGADGLDAMLACRLGGYSAMNTGEAFCRDISAVQVDGPNLEDGDPAFDLDPEDGLTPSQALTASEVRDVTSGLIPRR